MGPLLVGLAISIMNSKPSSLSNSVRIDSRRILSCSSALSYGVLDNFLEFCLLLLVHWELALASRIGCVWEASLFLSYWIGWLDRLRAVGVIVSFLWGVAGPFKGVWYYLANYRVVCGGRAEVGRFIGGRGDLHFLTLVYESLRLSGIFIGGKAFAYSIDELVD